MKRALTTREKIMLLVLVAMIIVLGYFKLILEPINLQVEDLNSKTMQEQIMIDQQRIQLAKMQRMQKKLDEMKESGQYTALPEYDNSGAVTVELDNVLTLFGATEHSEDYSDYEILDYIYARHVQMKFTVAGYEQVCGILDALNESENFNIITDLNIQWDNKAAPAGVTVTMRITYYEVMP